MSRDRSDLREALQDGAARTAGAGSGHPALDELAAYHRGELPEAEAERVREHLALCRECADLLLDWRDFARDEPPGAASAAAAAWERDREGVREGVRRRVGAAPRRAPIVPWLVAAAAAAAALVLAVLWWQARSELGEPRQVQLASVMPEGSAVLRGREDVPAVVVRPGARPVVALYLAEPEAFPRYEARIVPPAGEEAAFVVELSPQPSEPFVVQLGKDPEPGDYEVTLFGVADGERQEVATYSFRVHAP
ncbi:MAG TPA: zf-HC2 domain-containing protein [Thermoanaerobaculia bacterium]